ncbi:MAG: DUF6089 family protein [Saprospiraceae bacterium]
MGKALIIILFSTSFIGRISAQYFETGVTLGAASYFGDLQSGEIESSEYNPALGAFVRYNLSKHFALSGHLLQTRVSGDDDNSTLLVDQRRNLSFRSDVYEVGVVGELNLVPFNIPAGKKASPYIFAGISGFYFNPQAQYRGEWIDLQPIGTEGQGRASYGKKYSLVNGAIPFGAGFKFAVSDRVNVGLRFGLRYTFTDYLDDVSGVYPDISQLLAEDPLAAALSFREGEKLENVDLNPIGTPRGNAANNDWYFIGGITISFNLTDKYGLDFDQKYDAFKEGFEPEEKTEEPDIF